MPKRRMPGGVNGKMALSQKLHEVTHVGSYNRLRPLGDRAMRLHKEMDVGASTVQRHPAPRHRLSQQAVIAHVTIIIHQKHRTRWSGACSAHHPTQVRCRVSLSSVYDTDADESRCSSSIAYQSL